MLGYSTGLTPTKTPRYGGPVFWSHKALRRCEQLEDDLRKLKRDFLELQLEWTNTYDKLRTMMGRVAKRAEIVENAHSDASQPGGEPEFSANEQLFLSRLPPRQRQIQSAILLRRRVNGGTQ